MRNRRLFLPVVTLLPVALLVFWLLPAILKAMPSRYVARLPEPVQALGERGDGEPILPTVAVPVNASVLLADLISPTPSTMMTAVSEPPTLTPVPVDTSWTVDRKSVV